MLNKNKMHDNAKVIENYDKIKKKTKIRMCRDYLVNHLILQKINLKKPLSRGSRFKIYFRLERRGNYGSRQNFHEIPFSKKAY